MESVDVTPGHLGHLHPPQGWPDVALNRVAVAALGMRPLAADVLVEKPSDQVLDGRRAPLGFELGQRVATQADLLFEPACLLASRGGLTNRGTGRW